MSIVLGRMVWHIVQVARFDESPQTPLSVCWGGVAPPPPTSVVGPPVTRVNDGAGAVVSSLTAATAAARATAVAAPPSATQVDRRRRRSFFSKLMTLLGRRGLRSRVSEHDSAGRPDVLQPGQPLR